MSQIEIHVQPKARDFLDRRFPSYIVQPVDDNLGYTEDPKKAIQHFRKQGLMNFKKEMCWIEESGKPANK